MTITLPLVQALQSALGFGVAAGVAGGAAGAGASGGAQHGTAALAASGAIKPSALGNIFDSSGGIHKYVNTVVNKPTVFPFAKGGIFDPPPYGINRFAKGIGLMGEAGAEAVMPLERDSRGRLGVSVADDYIPGAGAAPRVNITINNQSGPPLRAEQQSAHQAPDGSWDFDVLVKTLEERMASRMNTRQSKLSPTMEGLYPGLARERAKAGMYR
jgi:phage-related minor tail protein